MGSMLLQVAFCGYCGGPLHGTTAKRPDGIMYHYYHCQKCKPHFAVQRAVLNEIVGDALLDVVGECELTAKRILAGNDHTETLARIEVFSAISGEHLVLE
jgi:hypothetical protein